MRKFVCVGLAVMALALAVPAMAQDDTSKFEAFVGYSFLHSTDNIYGAVYSYDFNGASGQVAYNLTHMFSIVGDIGGYTTDSYSYGALLDSNIISYLFGPRISFRSFGSRVVPYAQVLLGGARLANSITDSAVSDNEFAMTIGGGVDYRVTQRVWIRPIQAEYFMTKFTDGYNDRQNNFRYSAGVVLKF
jgi:opacity protein-like surface antigen